MAGGVPGERRHAVARPDALGHEALRGLQRALAQLGIIRLDDRALDGARHDPASRMLLSRVVDDLIGKKRPFLHQPEHRLPPSPSRASAARLSVGKDISKLTVRRKCAQVQLVAGSIGARGRRCDPIGARVAGGGQNDVGGEEMSGRFARSHTSPRHRRFAVMRRAEEARARARAAPASARDLGREEASESRSVCRPIRRTCLRRLSRVAALSAARSALAPHDGAALCARSASRSRNSTCSRP